MGVLTAIFNTLIVLLSLFLICLVLIQRGKGGGLAGAFGGAGGSSAFGTKAGDTFTRITIVAASIWILMTMLLVVLTARQQGASTLFDEAPTSRTRDLTPKSDAPAAPTPVGGEATPSAEPTPAPVPAPTPSAPVPNTSTFPLNSGNQPPTAPAPK
ncbi:preprotein translocase subunit SecG [Paludisphaera rhizosphaerae]|uniref:preprotein translocase subunit SecG n=1 Tax=Paludisphaera rhizosphaerae TaxID=2711216 RepID=UPI0021BCCD11|nr:preprotein translocase subunit SecG [Paludisphaera rhizosphaerae]